MHSNAPSFVPPLPPAHGADGTPLRAGSAFIGAKRAHAARALPVALASPYVPARHRAVMAMRADSSPSSGSQPGAGAGAGVQSFVTSASIAAAAVNAAVSMKQLDAPDDDAKTYIVKDAARRGLVDEDGLPVVYDKDLIEAYWRKEDGALQRRWREFLSVSVPFLTKLVAMLVRGGSAELERNTAELARDARVNIERLGPTYVKMGQMMSVRPDVLPQEALDELAVLQDSVQPFDTEVAVSIIEAELGGPLGQFFSEISEQPVAAASLAQVYKATLLSGETVAIKVQRPSVLSLVSKDLYVLRRAAEVYQGLMERFAPQQRTDYVALLNEWAIGFYTELDFTNEGANQMRLKALLSENSISDVYVPKVYEEFSTRRLLVTEWIDGCKLSECDPEEIRELIGIGQECFLTQLLQVGFFHSDPHPGNIMKMSDTRKGRIALLDFGLVASLQQEDMDQIVSAVIHLANKDYTALVDDFVSLGILTPDCDRAKVIPLMDKALSPYVKGGGAKKYEAELRRSYGMDGSARGAVGGFQAMTKDALTVFNDIPFTIPPYFALIGRAVVTLEGVALQGDPDYGLIMAAYPFVARKLLRDDRPEVQRALQDVLYTNGGDLSTARLSTLLNGALNVVAKTKGGVFIDLDSIPEEGVSLDVALAYLLGDDALSLRTLLADELETVADLLARQALRKALGALTRAAPRPPLIGGLLPKPEDIAGPMLLPKVGGGVAPSVRSVRDVVEAVAPKLTREEELYALSVVDVVKGTLGEDVGALMAGDAVTEPRAAARVVLKVLEGGTATGRGEGMGSGVVDAVRAGLRTVTRGEVAGRTDGGNWDEVVGAMGGLGEAERGRLRGEVDKIAEGVWGRWVQRLDVLTK